MAENPEDEIIAKPRRMQWRDEDMRKAIEAVSSHKMTISAASRVFQVPRKTLDDRIKGLVIHGQKPGPKLSSLTNYLLYMADRGFPLTRTMVKAFAWAIAKRSGKDKRFNPEQGPSEHWWQLFRGRHPHIVLRKSDKLDRNRAEAFNEVIVKEYFDGTRSHHKQIYNCDETFLPLDYTREKVVAAKGSKTVYSQTTGTTDHITLLCCASAAGLPLPPMIIYAKSFPGGQYRFQGPDDALYAKSESGWIDTELFMTWLNKIFLKYVVSQRPVLLLVDGHKSHITLDVIDKCRENDITLFCLPPHTTHALQPLDIAVFKSLKDQYAKAVRSLSFSKKNFVVTKREFSKVVKSPFENAFSIPNIKAGFSKTGIYPLNHDAIAKSKMKPSLVHGSSLSMSPSMSSDSDSTAHPPSSSNPGTPISPLTSSPATPVSAPTSSPATPVSAPTSTPATPLSPPTSSPLSSTSNSSGADCPTTPVSHPSLSSPQPVVSTRPLGIVNPLVAAGLISPDLMDILVAPSEDDAVSKKRTKRITGARDLTSEEYREILLADKRKKLAAEEEKQKRMEEREKKKRNRERKKLEKQNAGRGQGRGCRGRGRGRRKSPTPSSCRRLDLESSSDSDGGFGLVASSSRTQVETPPQTDMDTDDDAGPSTGRHPCRQRTMPSRYRLDSSDDDNDGTICILCKSNDLICKDYTQCC